MVDDIHDEGGSADTEDESIEADFRTAFEAAAEADGDEGGTATATATGDPDGDTGENDTEGKLEQEGSDDDAGEDGEDEASDGTPDFKPPQHWSAEHREQFEELTPDGKGIVSDIYKGMEAAHTKRSMELADVRKAFEPFQQLVDGSGVPLAQAVNKLAGIHRALQSDPEAEIKRLATEFGISLEAPKARRSWEDDDLYGEDEFDDEDEVSPRVIRLEEKLEKAEKELAEVKAGQTKSATAETNARVADFADAKGTDGELLHPHFAAVQSEMVTLANANKLQGKAYTLNDLYESAIWMVPDVRDKVQAALNGAKASNTKKEKADKVARAKNAGMGAKGSSKSPPPREEVPESIEDAFRQSFAAAAELDN